VGVSQAVRLGALERAMKVILPERHHRMLPLNMKALEAGAELARELV
jgi:2-oxoglutarate ferredoxin oxidoreductase subunit gamma